jgi:hypothetical protein
MPFKAKTDENGFVVIRDGNAVLLSDAGEEVVFTAPEKVSELNRESASRRHEIKELKAKLEPFDGLEAAEIKELKAFKENNKDAKTQIEQIKAQISQTYEEKIAEGKAVSEEKDKLIRKLSVSNQFVGSKFLADNTVLPAEIAEAYFGQYFEVRDGGAVVAKFGGNDIYSKTKPGELASFEEAIKFVVENSAFKDAILRDPGQGGSGAHGGDRKPAMGGQVNPWKKETRNLTLQSKIAAENPGLAAKMKAEAGIATAA